MLYRYYHLVICIAVFSFHGSGFAQHSERGCLYQANKFEAYRHRALGQSDSALYYFKQAFSLGQAAAVNDLLMAADRANQIDSFQCARQFILHGFGRGLTVHAYHSFLDWSGRGRINGETWISPVTIDSLIKGYAAQLDQPLLDKLKRLEYRDQLFRTETPDYQQMAVQDSMNVADLRQIVTNLGHLPKISEVGMEGKEVLELLFIHMDFENLDWFLPYVIELVHQAEYFDVEGLAYQIDRIAVSSGRALYVNEKNGLSYDTMMPAFINKQFYSVTGHWYDMSPVDGVEYFWPIFKPFRASQLKTTRQRLCLDSYEHYLQRSPYYKSAPINQLKELFGG